MSLEELMKERATLIGWKHSHGLTADEAARLDWLNTEAVRLCPLVTQEMTEAVNAIRARLDAMRARSKTPKAGSDRQ